MRIYGINPVLEALRAKRATSVRVSTRADQRVAAVVSLAEAQGVEVHRVAPNDLDRLTRGAAHQGVVADTRERAPLSVEDLVSGATGAPLLVVLDGIEDPHNVGAILRSVDAAGADGVVRQSRHAAALDGAAAKASAATRRSGTTRSISHSRRHLWSEPRGRDSAGWCGSGAIGWFPSRWRAMFKA